MKPKKIMFVLPRLHTNILPLIDFLESNQFKVSVLAFYSYKGKHAEDHKNVDISIAGFSRIMKLFPDSLRSKLGLPSIECFKKIYSTKPEIVVVREFVPSASVIHFFCRLIGIKTIMYSQKPLYGWKPSLLRQFYHKAFFPKPVFTTSLGNIEKKELTINKYTWGNIWEYIPFVAKINDAAEKRNYFNNNKINILVVGKFTERKMILEFLKVFNLLYKERKDLSLTLVGTILDHNVYEKVNDFINENYLPVSIRVLVPHNEMSELYLKHDVFVLPAVREPASISQLEAMCHGLAVLCSNDNGTAYYINPRRNGEVFDAKDFYTDLEARLCWILESRERIRNLGQESINIVKENHTGDKFISFINKYL
jgi:glycosyltransferase involved in cell wall biosynthesis